MEIFVSTSVKMDTARKAEIEKLAGEGKNSAQISNLMGDITPNTVAAYLKKIGKFEKGTKTGNSHKLTEEVKAQIDKLSSEGLNARQITDELGNIHSGTVVSYLKATGQYVRGHKHKTTEQLKAEKANQPGLNTDSLRNELLLAIKKLAKKHKCSIEDVLATLKPKD